MFITILLTEKPGAPSGKLRASKLTADSVQLDWLPPLDDGGSPLTGFIIEAMTKSKSDWKTFATVDPDASRHLLRKLVEGEEYYFRICSENAIGRSKWVELADKVKPSRGEDVPGPPKGPLVAENVSRDSIALRWEAPLSDGGSPITGYIVDKLDIQRAGWVRAARVTAGTRSYTCSALTNNHDYNFRIYAENKCGVGAPLDLMSSIKCKGKHGEGR